MFNVSRPSKNNIVVIRTATGRELSAYEKRKLVSIEENAQKNKIESASLCIDDVEQRIEHTNKEIKIDRGN